MNTVFMALALLVAVSVVVGLFLLLSRGSGGPRIPNVVGKTYREARQKIESVGFDVEIASNQDYSNVDDLDRKKVEDQDPKAGSTAEKGELVTVRLKGLIEITEASEKAATESRENPVSYTHLTLPTIYSV